VVLLYVLYQHREAFIEDLISTVLYCQESFHEKTFAQNNSHIRFDEVQQADGTENDVMKAMVVQYSSRVIN